MENLTEDQQRHIKSTKSWLDIQRNFIENLQIVKGNAERMVANQIEAIKITEREIPIEEKYLADGKSNFVEWCNNNSIEIPEWAS